MHDKETGFIFTAAELAQQLTQATHVTLAWLYKHGYLEDHDYEELMARMVVTPIKNTPGFGERILRRFFNKESTSDSFIFPITLLDEPLESDTETVSGKPSLTIVK